MLQGYEAPTKIVPSSLGDYLEIMSKVGFQSGMSWRVVESKWSGIQAALHKFQHPGGSRYGRARNRRPATGLQSDT